MCCLLCFLEPVLTVYVNELAGITRPIPIVVVVPRGPSLHNEPL